MSGENGWVPTEAVLAESRASALVRAAGARDFDELLRASTADPVDFWDLAVRHLDLPFTTPYETVLDIDGGAAWAKWFVGGRTNLVTMCVDRWLDQADRDVIDWHGEDGARRRWTVGELHRNTEAVAAVLRAHGVSIGDRVGLLMPMVPEAVAGTLAIAKIGAVAVPLFTGFGADAISVRLADAGAVAVLTADATLRRGSLAPLARTVVAAAGAVPTLRTMVVLGHAGGGASEPFAADLDIVDWPDATSDLTPTTTLAVPSDHELAIAYTSGTTGRPKGAVLVHGGLPVKVAAEGAFQHDLGPGDVLTWISDMGWIMGVYQIVAALANGAALCLVEGLPDHPGPDRLWSIVAESRITTLGTSPTLIRALQPAGDQLVHAHDLSSLRVLSSTGEPWNETPWQWYFEVVGGGRCPIINMSGGTEVGGALLSCHPVQPISPMSLGGPSLGVAADVFDPDGKHLVGGTGELVCTHPWPGMTKGLHGAPERYIDTYWSRWPGVWAHGDFASIDADGQWFIHGRSDDTMNIAGKRLGPVEPESALVSHPSVVEAAAIGMPDDLKGESLHVFVVLAEGVTASTELADELRATVADAIGPAFRPSKVLFVTKLPKTRSGKVMRRVVRATALGTDPGDLASLDDDSALDALKQAVTAP